jgi:Xaa-Pro aminopeptidase
MAQRGIDLLVLYGNAWQVDYLRYAVDYGPLEGEAIALVRRDGDATLFLDHPLEAERAEVEAGDAVVVYSPDMLADVEEELARAGNARIGAGPKRLLPRRLAARTTDLRISDETALVDHLLMNKLDEEIAAIRAAASMADEGYEIFRKAARPGRADYELVAEVEAFYRRQGVDDNFMIVGVGGSEVRGMAPPTGKRLKPGDLVTTELTPCVNGYYVQICRTLVLGAPSAEQTQAFGVFREALEAGVAAVRPGATAAEVAKAENDVFRRSGLGDYVTSAYTRVRGHGLGLFADTKPHILESVMTVIEKGMTLIVHPNTYHPTAGYIVLGDALIVAESGADVLTRTPRELIQVGVG